MLTSYEYTSQDPLGKIMDTVNCPVEKREALYAALRRVKRG